MKLTATQVKQAKPSAKPYKLADGEGMYLLIQATGSKYWRLKTEPVEVGKLLLAIAAFQGTPRGKVALPLSSRIAVIEKRSCEG